MAKEFILSQLNYQKHLTNTLSTKNTLESTKHKQTLLKKYFESKSKNEIPNQRYDVQKSVIQPSKLQIENLQRCGQQKRDKENSPISKVQSSCSNYSTKQERLQKDYSHYILKSTQDSQEFNKFIKSSSEINCKQQIFLKKNNNSDKRLSDPLHMTPLSSLIRQSQKKHSSMMEEKQQEEKQQEDKQQELMEVKRFIVSEQKPKILSPVKACFFSLKDEDDQRDQNRSISDERIKCFTINKMPKKSTKMHTQGKNESISTMNKLYEYILDVEL